MQFCNECQNLLTPIEEEGSLWNKCIDCGFKEEYKSMIIERKKYKDKEKVSFHNNKYSIYDKTLPRTIHIVCPNQECTALHTDDPEAVIYQDTLSLKLTYICVHCNTEWKYN